MSFGKFVVGFGSVGNGYINEIRNAEFFVEFSYCGGGVAFSRAVANVGYFYNPAYGKRLCDRIVRRITRGYRNNSVSVFDSAYAA